MKLEKVIDLIENKGIQISSYEEGNIICGYELNTYTDGGVNEIIFLDFRDGDLNPKKGNDFIKVFADYVNGIDIYDRIESNRHSNDYRQAFTLKESIEDFESWLESLKEITTLLV